MVIPQAPGSRVHRIVFVLLFGLILFLSVRWLLLAGERAQAAHLALDALPAQAAPTPLAPPQPGVTRFAVIGDYGGGGKPEADVAALVHGWNPDFILTVGDNNYPIGAAAAMDAHVGQYYQDFIFPYAGRYGAGANENRFFPTLGNHDWMTSRAQPYFDYFTLPGNERYYDFRRGPVHLFALDSDSRETDGITAKSKQGRWLQQALANATAPWKLVYFHHAPFSSAAHGSNATLQWPFATWGATAVLAGHDHTYERILRDGAVYFVNGLGGHSIYAFGAPIAGSAVRYNRDFGAMLVEATDAQITFQFIARRGAVIDTYRLAAPVPPAPASIGTFTPTPTACPRCQPDAR